MEKLYNKVTPVGYIKTEGVTYFLLSTYPVSPDGWEHNMLRWPVVPTASKNYIQVDGVWCLAFDAARHLIVDPSNCSIEIGYTGTAIMVWSGKRVEVPAEQQMRFPDWMTRND